MTVFPSSSKVVEFNLPKLSSSWRTWIFLPYKLSFFCLSSSIKYFTLKSLLLVSVQSMLTFIIYEFYWSSLKEYAAFRGGAPTSYLHNYGSNLQTPRNRDAFIINKNIVKDYCSSKELFILWAFICIVSIFVIFAEELILFINNNVTKNYLCPKWRARRRGEPLVPEYRRLTRVLKRWRREDKYLTHKDHQRTPERISR